MGTDVDLAKNPHIKIEGIADLVADLRKAPERLDKEFRARFRVIAKGVREDARDRAMLMHPRMPRERKRALKEHWDALVKSITSGAESNTPWVRVGSNSLAWATSFEFGSRRYREFPWLGRDGYFLWPAIYENSDEIKAQMLAAIDEAVGYEWSAGLGSKGTGG